MRRSTLILSIVLLALSVSKSQAQLVVTENNNAHALAQYLVGTGVIISNATLTNPSTQIIATGFFNNISGTHINIDSGIVLTNGKAKSDARNGKYGVDNDGAHTATAIRAANVLVPESTPSGDADLANELNAPISTLHDAVILEFDFIALGDSIHFNYVFGSEEYTTGTVCTFNDAFGFFISGPGFIGKKNLALIPSTNTPVSIKQVNNIPAGCINNPAYYVDNNTNRYFTYEGHTKVFTAATRVQPCQTYHLKLVIADVGDATWDSGVFIEAKSLNSNALVIKSITETDNLGNNYLVEGCSTGAFTIKRPVVSALPLQVSLSYGGTATNGVDLQMLPSSVIIPANDSIVTVDLLPIVDNLPEGIEELKIYASTGCNSAVPADSAVVQIRDYDTLAIIPKLAGICKGSSIQLAASTGYTAYHWDANPTLSNITIPNPVATPASDSSLYICSANQADCHARDSTFVVWRKVELLHVDNVICHNDTTGAITVGGGWTWSNPSQFTINGSGYQADSTFIHLAAGSYIIKMKDASNCLDSIVVNVMQLFPDLTASISTVDASCSGNGDGSIVVSASGGIAPYFFSSDAGGTYQLGNVFNVFQGSYPIRLYDVNGCTFSQQVTVVLHDTVTLSVDNDTTICEGFTHHFHNSSNAAVYEWTPVSSLNNGGIINPIASPTNTTQYFIKAYSGICIRTDSVTVFVNPAPVAMAGPDTSVCSGKSIQLNGGGGVQYQWYPGTFLNSSTLRSPVSTPLGNFSYYLNVIGANGCHSIRPDTIKIKVIPVVKMFAGHDTVVAINQPLQLNGYELSNSGVTSFTWSSGYGLNNPFIAAPLATLDRDMTYAFTGRTALGCTGTASIKIKVYKGPELYVPNAFTPNGDGRNDILRVISAGISAFHYFRIFNRWGAVVFSTSDPSKGWDGTIKGQQAGTGSYVWIAEAVDYTGNTMQRKGTVTVIR